MSNGGNGRIISESLVHRGDLDLEDDKLLQLRQSVVQYLGDVGSL
jgi:hypothetical protein